MVLGQEVGDGVSERRVAVNRCCAGGSPCWLRLVSELGLQGLFTGTKGVQGRVAVL